MNKKNYFLVLIISIFLAFPIFTEEEKENESSEVTNINSEVNNVNSEVTKEVSHKIACGLGVSFLGAELQYASNYNHFEFDSAIAYTMIGNTVSDFVLTPKLFFGYNSKPENKGWKNTIGLNIIAPMTFTLAGFDEIFGSIGGYYRGA